MVGALAIRWTKTRLVVGRDRYDPSVCAPLLIHPNPMQGAEERYVVVNSGHTFRGKDSATINYLLFPRLGDWAVMNVGPEAPLDATGKIRETPIKCGYFDESWSLSAE